MAVADTVAGVVLRNGGCVSGLVITSNSGRRYCWIWNAWLPSVYGIAVSPMSRTDMYAIPRLAVSGMTTDRSKPPRGPRSASPVAISLPNASVTE